MAFSEVLQILITANGSQAVGEFQKVGASAKTELGGAEKSSADLSRKFVRGGVLMVGAAAAIGVGLNSARKAFEEAQLSDLKLQNSLKNNPRLAGESADSFRDQAKALQQLTAADGDAIIEAQAMLGTFRMTGDEIRTLTPLVVDYARKFDVDLVSAAKQVGKAMDGQVGALKRNGVTIDEAMFKVDRFRAVQEALNGQVGGFGEREGKTFNGQMEIMKNNLGDVQEAIGGGVSKVLMELMPLVRDVASGFSALDGASGGVLGQFLVVAAAGLALAGTFSVLAGGLIKLKAAMATAGFAGGKGWMLAASIGAATLGQAVGGATGEMVSMIGTGAAIGTMISPGFGSAIGAAAGLTLALIGVGNSADKAQKSIKWAKSDVKDYAYWSTRAAETSRGMGGDVLTAAEYSDLAAGSARDLVYQFKQVAKESPQAAQGILNQAQAAGVDAETLEKLRGILDDSTTSQAELEGAARKAAQKLADQGRAAELTKEQIQLLNDIVKQGVSAQLNYEGAVLGTQRATENYNTVMNDAESTEMERAEAQLALKRTYTDLTTAIEQNADKDRDGIITKEESAQADRDKIAALGDLANGMAPGSPVRVFLDQYIMQLRAASGDFVARMILQSPSNFREVFGQAQVNFGMGWVSVTNQGGRLVAGARAHGGPVSAGGAYLVGERGPEMLQMGSMGGNIVPNHALGGGGNVYVTVNAPVGSDAAAIGRSLQEYLDVYRRRAGLN